jgi:outer membrane protein OmpA-like peptidoglycan-associated protein
MREHAAKNFLTGLGIDPVRIVAVSKGATARFAPGTTEEAYQLNRRDQFISIKPGTGTGALTTYRTNE